MMKNDDSQYMPPMTPRADNNMQYMPYRVIYPELYYRLQPYILSACDELDSYDTMPSQEMIEKMSDSIYEDMLRMYPDFSDYIREHGGTGDDSRAAMNPIVSVQRFRPRSRRRGLFRDFIDILLLSELNRRRRRRRFDFFY